MAVRTAKAKKQLHIADNDFAMTNLQRNAETFSHFEYSFHCCGFETYSASMRKKAMERIDTIIGLHVSDSVRKLNINDQELYNQFHHEHFVEEFATIDKIIVSDNKDPNPLNWSLMSYETIMTFSGIIGVIANAYTFADALDPPCRDFGYQGDQWPGMPEETDPDADSDTKPCPYFPD